MCDVKVSDVADGKTHERPDRGKVGPFE